MTTSGSLSCLRLLDALETKIWATLIYVRYKPDVYTVEPVPSPLYFSLNRLEVRVCVCGTLTDTQYPLYTTRCLVCAFLYLT